MIFILLVGFFLRLYKLDWGEGLYTHPDEYHIVTSVSQLVFPTQMHPHFFSYGTVTIYLIYFTQELLKPFSLIPNSFIFGRFYSALFSTLTILIVYKICRSFMERRFSYLAALLIALTPGLIQQAHFATPESALTFFLFGSLLFIIASLKTSGVSPRMKAKDYKYEEEHMDQENFRFSADSYKLKKNTPRQGAGKFIIKFLKHDKFLYLGFASIFLGFALGVKISSAVFLLPILTGIIIKFFRKPFRLILFAIASLAIAIATFAIVAPFVFLDFPAFRDNLEYEGSLAVGKISVFYTRQFIDTVPVLFQIEKILPYALGPVLLLFSALGFMLVVINLIRKPKIELIIIMISFLSLFLANAFLFAKWTRFIAPAFPFFAIFASFLIEKLYAKNHLISNLLAITLLVTTFLWTTAFFSIYLHPDVRVTASKWVEENTDKNSTFLVEGGNMIDIPLKGDFKKISLDFYALEENRQNRLKIAEGLEEADYFLIQSRRVFLNHQGLPDKFPKTARFYDMLFNGRLGFEKIKQFSSYPKLSSLGLEIEFPDENAEETWSVFDHPVIRVFKKTKQLSKEDYAKFLNIESLKIH